MLMGIPQLIRLDSSSPSSYKRKYTVLLHLGRNDDAIAAFGMMLSKMLELSDPEICGEDNHIIPVFFH